MNTYPFVKVIMKFLTLLHTQLYKKLGGKFLGTMFGNPICMIITKGAKSGKIRKIPLLTIPYQEDYLLVASSGGSPVHPAWYFNLVNEPKIKMTIRSKTFEAHAKELSDQEKERIWPIIIEACPYYEDYRKQTNRKIPVFICSRV
tara:strand:+ start:533 stop:967 length:435 start_codon:yes stop_codon:yes gene_type:complete